jgi:hypothetical protein
VIRDESDRFVIYAAEGENLSVTEKALSYRPTEVNLSCPVSGFHEQSVVMTRR